MEFVDEKRLNISQSKVELRKTKVGFLRHYIINNEIELQEHISKKTVDFPEITNKKELQSFLELIN